jgi:tetratricopeptide (TPR) repeat protein
MAPEEKKESLSIPEIFADFIQRNRKVLILGMTGIALAVIAFVAGISIRDFLTRRAIAGMEELTGRFEALRFEVNEPSKEGEVKALLDELALFAEKNTAYAGARAYMMIADIHMDRKNWEEAEKAYTQAARKAPRIYLTPAALFNAAVAAEERGNISGAIALYAECLSQAEQFPAAPRAQFAVGRLEEAQGNSAAAVEAYRAVIEKWPGAAVWTNMANSRIILLEGGK